MSASESNDAIAEAKRALRAAAARARDAAHAALVATAGAALRDKFMATIAAPEGVVVSGYWPIGSEIDPRPVLAQLHARGHVCGLPVVEGRGKPLLFRRWRPGEALVPARFGLSVPRPEAEVVTPGLLLVPLLAFDAAGYRLGYGGGFYDRTLAALRGRGRVIAVGIAYAAQEVPAVPREDFDQRLDWVVTEAEARRFC